MVYYIRTERRGKLRHINERRWPQDAGWHTTHLTTGAPPTPTVSIPVHSLHPCPQSWRQSMCFVSALLEAPYLAALGCNVPDRHGQRRYSLRASSARVSKDRISFVVACAYDAGCRMVLYHAGRWSWLHSLEKQQQMATVIYFCQCEVLCTLARLRPALPRCLEMVCACVREAPSRITPIIYIRGLWHMGHRYF